MLDGLVIAGVLVVEAGPYEVPPVRFRLSVTVSLICPGMSCARRDKDVRRLMSRQTPVDRKYFFGVLDNVIMVAIVGVIKKRQDDRM